MAIVQPEFIQISAPRNSFDRVRQFYGDLLGLNEIEAPESAAGREGAWFALGSVPLLVQFEGYGFSNEPGHLALYVDDLDVFNETLRQRVAPIERETGVDDVLVRLRCKDPFGNRLEFAQLPEGHRPVDPVSPGRVVKAEYAAQAELLATYRVDEGDVEQVAISPDGVWLAAGSSTQHDSDAPTLAVWKLGGGSEPEIKVEMSATVLELAFAPTGDELTAMGEDGSLEVWRPGDFESLSGADHPKESSGLAYAQRSKLIAIGSGQNVHIYRDALGQLMTIRPGLGDVLALSFDAENTLAISGEATRVSLWQLQPAQRSAFELRGHERPLVQIAFAPGEVVYLAGLTDDGRLYVWNIYEGPEAPFAHPDPEVAFECFEFSPSGDALAAASGDRVTLCNWRSATWDALLSFSTDSEVLDLAFTPDGGRLACACADGNVRLFRIR
jgi:WD40 repeat protein